MFIYRDDDLAVINKPAGMLVHRGWARERVVAMTWVRDQVGAHVYPVHRLDRSASGVLVFALHRDAARGILAAFSERRVAKRYVALVRGPAPSEGLVDHPIPRNREPNAARVDARTAFRSVYLFERYSVVEAWPETGRTHQIRRHFKHESLPLIGDVRYGKGEHNRLFRERFGFHRLALHATQLWLPHPREPRVLSLFAPLPPEMATLWQQMGCPLPSPLEAPWTLPAPTSPPRPPGS